MVYNEQKYHKNNVTSQINTVINIQNDANKSFYLHTIYIDSIESISTDNLRVITRTESSNSSTYFSFGVSAYAYTNSWDGTQLPNYMYNITFNQSKDSWTSPSNFYWPGVNYKLRFFAYAPNNNSNYILSGATVTGPPTLDCTIPSDVSEQKDLLVSNTGELAGNYNSNVSLTFKHALVAVKFACGSDMGKGTIKNISLKNVYNKGIYNMESNSWTPNTNSIITFTQTLEKQTTEAINEAITTEDQTFMMIPQTLPGNAQIEIIFNDGITDHTLTANIGGTTWDMGKTITYKISTSSINWTYTLQIEAPKEFQYYGGNSTYKITSYKKNSSNIKQEVA